MWASIGQLSGPILHLESALLRFFEQFGSVLRSQFNYFLDERCFLRSIDLGRRSGTRRNRYSQLFEELLLASGEQMQSILTGVDKALWNW